MDGRRTHRPLHRLRKPGNRGSRGPQGSPIRLQTGGRRARRTGAGGGTPGLCGLVVFRGRPEDADPQPRRAHRDPTAAGRRPQERGRHQDGRRCHRARLRARLHHDVRDLHRRLRLHPARPQAAGAQQAGHRRRTPGLDVAAAASGVRRVPVLRAARRDRLPHGRGLGERGESSRRDRTGDDRRLDRTAHQSGDGDPRRYGTIIGGSGALVTTEANPPPQGPDVLGGRLRLPSLRGVARASRGEGRPRARPGELRW